MLKKITCLEQVMSRVLPQFDGLQGKLAHGDFDTTHIYQHHGCYTGTIDFGEIRGANQWYDLGHFHLRDGETLSDLMLPALVQGYNELAKAAALLQETCSCVQMVLDQWKWF